MEEKITENVTSEIEVTNNKSDNEIGSKANSETSNMASKATSKKKINKKLVIAGGTVVVIAAAALIATKLLGGGATSGFPGAGGAGGQGGAPGAGASQQVSYTVVKTETPHTGDVSVTSSLTGTVEASDVVYLYAKAAGDVTSVDVSAGDTVEEGQLLMTINTDQIASAQNQLDSAEVNLNSAKSDLNRMSILYNGGDITAQEYETYQNKLKSAQLSYESAKINYDKQVSYSQITAPIAGRVESIDVDVYDHVNNNEQLIVISGEGEQRVLTYVTERMVHNIRTGDPVAIYKNGKEYAGKVSEVNTMVDSSTGLFKVKAQLENTDEITTGSSVKIILTTDRAENATLVPVDAIYYSGGDAYLYVVEDGVAHMKSVEVGLYDDQVAEIESGVEMTDNVVSTWSNNIYEGANIRLYDDVQNAKSDTANAQAADGAVPNADKPAGAPSGAAPTGAGAPATSDSASVSSGAPSGSAPASSDAPAGANAPAGAPSNAEGQK